MTPHAHARTGYAQAAAPTRSARDTEYALFAQITRRLKDADPEDASRFAETCEAVLDNTRLWMTLAEDLMKETNGLPAPLRGQLLSLAVFVQRHSMKVMNRSGTLEPLIDINVSIMKGLRGEVEAPA